MENGSTNFFIKNIDYIKNIISILIGSGIGYVTTTKAERRKEKRRQNLEKLNSILIPLSEYIENSINIFENIDFTDKNFSYIKSETKKFLKVQNKIYYPNIVIEYLNNFLKGLDNFKIMLEKEEKNFQKEYEKYINDILKNYDEKLELKIILSDCFLKELNKTMLNKNTINRKDLKKLSLEIDSINRYSISNPKEFDYELIEEKEILKKEGKINSLNNYTDEEDFFLDNCYLFFIDDNLDVEKLANLLSKNNSKIKFNELFNLLNNLKKEIDSKIKKILKS